MRLHSLKLRNFKGVRDFTLDAQGQNINVYGDNETGKTSLFDAFTYLLFGKDSQNKADFEIKTDKDGREIYEGDLVEWDGQSIETYEIIYGTDASFFGVPVNGKLERVSGESLSLLNANLSIVVVGDIHDNGESHAR